MKAKRFVIGFSCLLIVLLGVSLLVGRNALSIADLRQVLEGNASQSTQLILWNFRLPRGVIAILAGWGLGVSGFLLQGITRNPIADASILGVNSGAGLFIMIYLGFFAQGSLYLLPLLGIFGGFLAAGLVLVVAYRKRQILSMDKVLLAGIAVNAGLSAVTLIATIKISKNSYNFVVSWLAGSIWGASWSNICALLPWLLILGAIAFYKIPLLRLLGLGEERALALGVNVGRERFLLLLLAVGLTASSIAYAGSLTFVGLLAPHMAKSLLKVESRASFMLSGLISSCLVLLADIIARVILPSGELPTGMIIAAVGAPYFIYLMLRQKI
ncbi:MAG: FecCD family ABC transporter permease [Enterococcus sp.]